MVDRHRRWLGQGCRLGSNWCRSRIAGRHDIAWISLWHRVARGHTGIALWHGVTGRHTWVALRHRETWGHHLRVALGRHWIAGRHGVTLRRITWSGHSLRLVTRWQRLRILRRRRQDAGGLWLRRRRVARGVVHRKAVKRWKLKGRAEISSTSLRLFHWHYEADHSSLENVSKNPRCLAARRPAAWPVAMQVPMTRTDARAS